MNIRTKVLTVRCCGAEIVIVLIARIWRVSGPSYSAQGGYGSLFHFMGEAKQQIEAGLIDAAVIACGNFILSKRSLLVLRGMGLMADDGECRAFDENGKSTFRFISIL